MCPFSVEAAAHVTHSPGRIGYDSKKLPYNRLFGQVIAAADSLRFLDSRQIAEALIDLLVRCRRRFCHYGSSSAPAEGDVLTEVVEFYFRQARFYPFAHAAPGPTTFEPAAINIEVWQLKRSSQRSTHTSTD